MTADLATYAENICEACNSHDTDRLLSLCSPDYTGSDVSQAEILRGRDGLRTLLETFWKAFPDLRLAGKDVVIQGSRLAVIWIAEGTHRGPIMNIPPTGRSVKVSGMFLIDVREGLVVRGQSIWDLAGMLRNLGLLPELS